MRTGRPNLAVEPIPWLKISSLLLVLLAQFSGCASSLRSLSLEDEFGPRHLFITIPFVGDIALLSQDDFLVVARPTDAPAALVRAPAPASTSGPSPGS
jgi:hypothetical protein